VTAATAADAARVLRETFGFEAFRPGQEAVVERLLAGRSALAVFPTGGGKSLCYQLPALLLEGVTVVVSPLIALMKDQVEALARSGVAAARLDSSLSGAEARDVLGRLERGDLRLLYVAPERLSNERFLRRLKRARVALLAVDEAHCISEWGHNFRPDYLKLAELARALPAERVLALTATATPGVAADVRRAFGIADGDEVRTPFYRANLDLEVTPCPAEDRQRVLLERLTGEAAAGSAIVYVTYQATAERVAEALARGGVAAAAYHAGLEGDARSAVQDAFMAGEVRVVVATIAFGMGIDKADVRAVLHYNLPKTLENYAQEVGRAGRDGARARCEVLACADDATPLAAFVHGDAPDRAAIAGLVRDVLGRGDDFGVARYALGRAHDVRPLVVATALTYLELEGVLAPTSPFYAVAKVELRAPLEEVLAPFDPERRAFLEAVFRAGSQGRRWLTIDVPAAAEALGERRERIAAALGYLEEQGALTLQVAKLTHGYRVVDRPDDPEPLIDRLHERFAGREARDVGRVDDVLAFLGAGDCLWARLRGYFEGEPGEPCGHCASCRAPGGRQLPRTTPAPLGEAAADLVRRLAAEGQAALARPRQLARFLTGIKSPATTAAKLTRDPRFGSLAAHPFGDVLALAEGPSPSEPRP